MTTKANPRRATAPAKVKPEAKPAPKSKSLAKAKPALPNALLRVVNDALDDMKAVNVKVIDVRHLTDITDIVVVASGNSDRHVKSIADRVVQFAKQNDFRPMGVEGAREGEWVLVDLTDVVVHVMLPRVREFYGLENLWEDATPADSTKVPKEPKTPKAEKAEKAPPRPVRAAPRARAAR